MNWNGKRVFVTGAGGFIGSHLCERLVGDGADVTAFVHYNSLGRRGWLDESAAIQQIRVIAGDVRDRSRVASAMEGCSAVFHLAALIGIPYSYVAASSYVQTNVMGTLNVLECAREHEVERVVHTSTSEVYGTALRVPIDEQHPLQGQSPYSASKIGADKMAEAFHKSFGLPVAVVRPFNTYGPRQSARALIPTIVTQLLAGNVVRVGHVHPTRDFLYVADTVDGFVRAAEAEGAIGRVINLGTGREIAVGDLVERIAALMGKRADVVSEAQRKRPARSEVERLCASSQLAHEILEWGPHHSLDEGLGKTIAWIGEHRDRFRPQVYAI